MWSCLKGVPARPCGYGSAVSLLSIAVLCLGLGATAAHARPAALEVALVPLATTSEGELAESVEGILDFKTELEPLLWNGMDLQPQVRDRAGRLAERIVSELGVPGTVVEDIVVLGSLASYEYDDYSDVDIHVFVRIDDDQRDIDTLRRYITQFNYVNVRKYEGLTFYGYPVEIMVYTGDPSSQIQAGVGMYSIVSGAWLNEPTQNLNSFDEDAIYLDAKRYITLYNEVAAAFNARPVGFDCSRFTSLAAEMRRYRTEGIGLHGIRSTPNLTYRMLRRLNINLPDSLREASNECASINSSLY